MVISLDYDDTYTADPKLWQLFIKMARMCGHRVVCITARNDTPENRYLLGQVDVDEVCFTGHTAKIGSPLAGEVDIWIDDNPHAILQDGG